MKNDVVGRTAEQTKRVARRIGQAGGTVEGPTLVVVGALHGNELAGVKAAKRVLAHLEKTGAEVRGELIALIGNLSAMRRGTRFVQSDLNRLWSADRVLSLESAPEATVTVPEEIELRDLAATLAEIARGSTGPFALVDLHTSSADSPPFVAVGDDPLVDRVVARTGVIEVKGTSRYLQGMLVEHASRTGWSALAFEAGRHEDEVSIACHEAMVWQLLLELGMVDESVVPDEPDACTVMQRGTDQVSRIVEIVYRHALNGTESFRMKPGFENFQRVAEGEVLGQDRHGDVLAPLSGRVFLPLYQEQGDEGFFIVRDVGE